jgi:cytochrome c
VDRPVASAKGFTGYSASMQAHGGNWTPEALDAFLTRPSAYISGTSMSFAGLKKPQERADLIAYLQTIN